MTTRRTGDALDELAAMAARVDETRVKPGRSGSCVGVDALAEPYAPFPVVALPQPVARYVSEAASALGCDPSYVAPPMLAALASAIGTTRRIQLKRDWAEPCVVWAVIVGESGTLKSPAIDVATTTLRAKQREAFAAHAKAMAAYERNVALWEADYAAWKRNGRKKGEPPPEEPAEPTAQRYIVGDVTVEALADRLQYASRGLLLSRDELAGWINGFDQYKGGKGSDAAHWLTLHGARDLIVDRKSTAQKVIYVPRAAVSITGGIQPGTLRRALTPDHVESGLAARLLLAMPPARAKRWSEAQISDVAERRMAEVFDALLALEFGADRDGEPAPIDVPLTAAGKAAWMRFYGEHAAEQTDLTGEFAAAWSKLEGYAARLALVVHLVRVAAGDVTLERGDAVDGASIAAGVTLSRWFGGEARRVYGVLGEDPDATDRRRLVEMIERKGGAVTARDVQRGCWWLRETGTAEAALSAMVKAGVGRWADAPTTAKGGRPSRVFRLTTASTIDVTPAKPDENAGFVNVESIDAENNAELLAAFDENEVIEWTA